jgi:hypothetical protein
MDLFFGGYRKDQPVESNDAAHESGIFTLDWHPVGHILVSGSNDHATRFWTRSRPGERSEDILGTANDSEVAEEGMLLRVSIQTVMLIFWGGIETDAQQLPGLGSRAKTQQPSNGFHGRIPGFNEPTPVPSLYSQRGRSAGGGGPPNEPLTGRAIPGIHPSRASQIHQEDDRTGGSLPTPVLPQSFMKPSVSMMPPPLPGLGSANRPPMMPPLPPLPPVPSASKVSKRA